MSAISPPDINGIIVSSLTSILKMVTLVILRGAAVYFLWGWFIVPLGVISIGIAHSFGIAIIAKYLTSTATEAHSHNKNMDADDKKIINLATWMGPFMVTFFGYIVHLFM